MLFTDTVALAGTRRTGDGYLVVDARAARTGIQVYTGKEADKPELPFVRMLRPAEEVFSTDSLATFANKPVTRGHPKKPVTATDYAALAKGHTGESVARDGEFVRVPMMVTDAAAIAEIESGSRELSAGYVCDVDWTAGVTDAGEAYDAVQRKIRVNHVAFVDRGRAGPQCRIGDSWAAFDAGTREPGPIDPPRTPPTTSTRDNPSMKTLLIDGHTVALDDAAFIAVSALQKQLGTAVADALSKDAALKDANTAHGKTIEAKDGEIVALKAEHAKAIETKTGEMTAKDAAHSTAIQAKDGEIAALKAQIPDAAKLDALAGARADLIGKAKSLLGDGFDATGKADGEIRRAVVEKAIGEGAKTMTDAAIDGAFTVVTAGKAPNDPIRTAMRDAKALTVGDERATAFADMRKGLENRWQGTPAA